MDTLNNIHPGEILLEEFLIPMQISQNKLANAIGVPPRRINEIVLGKRTITADTALRLGLFFSMEPRYWLNLQTEYDMRMVTRNSRDKIAPRIRVFPSTTMGQESASRICRTCSIASGAPPMLPKVAPGSALRSPLGSCSTMAGRSVRPTVWPVAPASRSSSLAPENRCRGLVFRCQLTDGDRWQEARRSLAGPLAVSLCRLGRLALSGGC